MLYSPAVFNLKLLVCICFQVVLLCPFWRKKDQKLLHTEGVFTSAFCSCRERSFSQALARHGSPWLVCRVLRNSLHAGIWENIYPRCTQTSSHNGLQTAPAAIEHLNGAGFAFGDELPLLLKALIRTNDNCGFLFKLPFDGTVGCSPSAVLRVSEWAGIYLRSQRAEAGSTKLVQLLPSLRWHERSEMTKGSYCRSKLCVAKWRRGCFSKISF